MSDFAGSYSLITDAPINSAAIESPSAAEEPGRTVQGLDSSESDTEGPEPVTLWTNRVPKNSILKKRTTPSSHTVEVRGENQLQVAMEGDPDEGRRINKVTFSEDDPGEFQKGGGVQLIEE